MTLGFRQEDYYDVLHRRERAAPGKPLGGRTTLRVDSDLEHEFLVSSSEDERTRRAAQARHKPARYNPAREHYANLAAVKGLINRMEHGKEGRAHAATASPRVTNRRGAVVRDWVDPYEDLAVAEQATWSSGRVSPAQGRAAARVRLMTQPRSARSVSPIRPRAVPTPASAPLPAAPTPQFMAAWRARRTAARRRSSIELFLAESREELAVSEGGTGDAVGSTYDSSTYNVREALGEVLEDAQRSTRSPNLITSQYAPHSTTLYDVTHGATHGSGGLGLPLHGLPAYPPAGSSVMMMVAPHTVGVTQSLEQRFNEASQMAHHPSQLQVGGLQHWLPPPAAYRPVADITPVSQPAYSQPPVVAATTPTTHSTSSWPSGGGAAPNLTDMRVASASASAALQALAARLAQERQALLQGRTSGAKL